MFNIKEELKKLPDNPGVYIMKDKNNNVIYVGKAVCLKNRVRQYFQKTNKTARIERMVSLIDNFEYIITDNEAEALILECNLIKKHMPKFNVLLKDDKTYPYIKIDINSKYPNIYYTRKKQNDGAKYFGPYASSGAAKEILQFIKDKFQIRQCKKFKSTQRACINYEIKKCLAPCIGLVSEEEYKKQIKEIIMFLEGKTGEIIKNIDSEINYYSQRLEYEKAAILRDRKNAIMYLSEKQKVSNINDNSIDVIGIYKNSLYVCLEIFFIRNSKMIGREHYFLNELHDEKISTILQEFIKQYYLNKSEIPSKILMQEKIEDEEIILKILSKKLNKKLEFKTPQKGEKLKLVEMAIKNVTLQNKTKETENILLKLKKQLSLEKLPERIECFDISNFAGENIVAGMCVAENGIIKRNLARKFKIKTITQQNDIACMKEVLERRLKHSLDNPKGNFQGLPDVIFADGGINQVNAINEVLQKYSLDISVFGMVKNQKHRTQMLINSKNEQINITDDVLLFITRLQDEVHRIAIQYNKKLMNKKMVKSDLDKIEGIGAKRKQELLKKFGSVENIKKADIKELQEIKGINEEITQKLKNDL